LEKLQKTVQLHAEELRSMELERLRSLQVSLWSRAKEGDLGAVDRILKIMERRAKLTGLDSPETEVDVVNEIHIKWPEDME
jgi:hypothetical protein